jgi:hypothetical protein
MAKLLLAIAIGHPHRCIEIAHHRVHRHHFHRHHFHHHLRTQTFSDPLFTKITAPNQ